MISGEYQAGKLTSAGVLTTWGGGSTGQGSSNTVSNKGFPRAIHFSDGKPRTVLFAWSNLHTFFCVTPGSGGGTAGDTLWAAGLNDGWIFGSSTAAATNSFVAITRDASGNPLTNITSGWGSATAGVIDVTAWVMVTKSDGTVWRIGNATGGLTGDGTTGNSRGVDSFFVQVPSTNFGGHKIVKIRGMFFPVVLDDAGNPYDWGNQNYIGYQLGQTGDYRSPHLIPHGTHTAIDITSNSLATLIITSDGHLWGFSFYKPLLGVGGHWSSPAQQNTPTDITAAQGLTGLTYVACTNVEETFYVKMSNGHMYSFGDNPEGTGGVRGDAGYSIDVRATGYNYNGGNGENIIPLPLDPFAGCSYTVYQMPEGGYYQRDGWIVISFDGGVTFHYYHVGRNKNGVGLFKVNGDPTFNQEAVYPDWVLDVIPTEKDITSVSQTVAEADTCGNNHSALFCRASYNPPTEANPTGTAGSNQNVTIPTATVTGSATAASGHTIKQYQWSGACGVLFGSTFSASASVSGLTPGPNVLTLTATDDANKISSFTVTIAYNSSPQLEFYFAGTGSGTACSFAAPCAPSYLPTALAAATSGQTYFLNGGDNFPAISNSTPGVGVTSYGTGQANISGLTTLSLSGGTNQTGTCSGCTANTRLLVFNGVIQSYARTPNIPQVFAYTPGSSTTTVLAVNSGDLTTVGTITGKTIGVWPFSYAIAKGVVASQTTNTVTFSPAMPTGFTGGNGWWVYGTTPDTVGEYTYSGGTSGTFTVNGSSGQTVQTATVDTTVALYGAGSKISNVNITGANTALLYLGGVRDSAVGVTATYSGMDGIQINAKRVYISGCSVMHGNNIGINNLSTSDTGLTILNTTDLHWGNRPGMQQTGNSQAIGIVSPVYGTVIYGSEIGFTGGNGIYSGHADSIYIRRNKIHDYNLTWIDGGGGYLWNNSGLSKPFGDHIDSCLIYNGGIGPWAFLGKSINNSSASYGVYTDSRENGDTMTYNTIWNNISGAWQNHGPSNVFTNNTIGGDQYAGFTNAQFSGGPTLTGVVFSNNTSYDSLPGVPLIRNITLGNDSTTILTADNNVYVHATNPNPFWTKNASSSGAWFNLAGWKAASAQDAHSTLQSFICRAAINYGFVQQDLTFPYVGRSLDGKTIYRNQFSAQPALSGSVLQELNKGQFWRYRKKP